MQVVPYQNRRTRGHLHTEWCMIHRYIDEYIDYGETFSLVWGLLRLSPVVKGSMFMTKELLWLVLTPFALFSSSLRVICFNLICKIFV